MHTRRNFFSRVFADHNTTPPTKYTLKELREPNDAFKEKLQNELGDKYTQDALSEAHQEFKEAALRELLDQMTDNNCALGKVFFKQMLDDHGPDAVLHFVEAASKDFYTPQITPGEENILRESKPEEMNRRSFTRKAGMGFTALVAGIGAWRIWDALEEIGKERENKAKNGEDTPAYYEELNKIELKYPDNSVENLSQGMNVLVGDVVQFLLALQYDQKWRVSELRHATEWLGKALSIPKQYAHNPSSPAK